MVWLNEAKRERQELEEDAARRQRAIQEEQEKAQQAQAQREAQCRMNRNKAYDSLGYMVRRLLEDLGQAQWGSGGYKMVSYNYGWHVSKKSTGDGRAREYGVNLAFNPDGTPRYFHMRGGHSLSTDDLKEESLKRILSKAYIEGPLTYEITNPSGFISGQWLG